ncbi:Vacuolar protein-sorting-associated protein 25 [Armadillidium vulgare]|nr:Vacuolar protein-sorting-associated protein 25 [Armadillidium vulgare]
MMSNDKFSWPWQYNFPPFFTLQKNKDVLKVQLDTWCNLVIDWGKFHNIVQLDVAEAPSLDVFKNTDIKRNLSPESVLVVLDELAQRGNLEWTDKKRALLFWRSPAEWAEKIYSWVQNSNRINTVCTLYELTQGDETINEAFHGLDEVVLMKALSYLESKNHAEVMNFGDSRGVKFY